jgi:3-methyladenine DNA glycosylase AlkD
MVVTDIMQELEEMGSEGVKRIHASHGAREPFFGVKVGDLKKIVKRVKKNHELSMALFDTGNSDAMYLAGLIADEKKISKTDLNHWADKAYWSMLSEYTVSWVAAESPHGWELGLDWIKSDRENIASAGWSTLANWVALRPDHELDMAQLEFLMEQIVSSVHESANRVRHTMNGFLIAAGIASLPLTDKAIDAAKRMGGVTVDVGGTACQVPDAIQYIENARSKGRLGVKKKQARC